MLTKGNIDLHCQVTVLVYADDDITAQLDLMVQASFPEEYKKLRAAYAAGHRWTGIPLSPTGKRHNNHSFPLTVGPFLGRATLWKLQVRVHRDPKDYLCALFNDGEYEGGVAVFPDLGLRLRYVFPYQCLLYMLIKWDLNVDMLPVM